MALLPVEIFAETHPITSDFLGFQAIAPDGSIYEFGYSDPATRTNYQVELRDGVG
jgi:hypothetical protein